MSLKSRLIYCVFLFVTAVFLIKFDLVKLINICRINLTPSVVFLDGWKEPPVPVETKVYIFNYTNVDRFMSGEDEKLELQEIGPIIYHKYVKQNNLEFHEDSTMSYTTNFDMVFPEDLNIPGILNKTVVVPNTIVFTMATMANNKLLMKLPMNIVLYHESLFVNRTVYDYLWNFTSPTLEKLKTVLPNYLIPSSNAGVLYNYASPLPITYNVNYGTKHGFSKFFQVNTINGATHTPGYSQGTVNNCPSVWVNESSDGTGNPPYLQKTDILNFYHYMLPKPMPSIFIREVKHGLLTLYEFSLDRNVYVHSGNFDCFDETAGIELPDGLMDTSEISFGAPLALSPPHFFTFYGDWEDYLDGLNPNKKEHYGCIRVEPLTGSTMLLSPKLQLNLVLSKFNFQPKINKLGGKILPLVWIDYHMETDTILSLMVYVYAMVIFLPIIQMSFIVACFIGIIYEIFVLYKTSNEENEKDEVDEVEMKFVQK
ncbi:SCRB7.2 family protein [Megaselia abdita]